MPKFKVKSTVRHDGKEYKPGDTIEVEKDQALLIAEALDNPPRPETPHDAGLAAALKSQADRPDPATADWKVDAETQRIRREERARAGEKEARPVPTPVGTPTTSAGPVLAEEPKEPEAPKKTSK